MMYYKIIDGKQVISTCTAIRLQDGTVVCNPTPAQIAAEGWLEYIPPVIPQNEPGLAEAMEAVRRMLASETEELSDEDALAVAALFPTWASKMGEAVTAGERLWDDGRLWKVLQAHTVSPQWRPAEAVSLYVEVSIAEWPEFVQPTGAHDAYMAGDKVTFQGQHYISLVNNNSYSPADYPANWELRP